MEMTLFAAWVDGRREEVKMTYLQGSLCLDLLDHDVCKRLVKLETTVTFLTAQNAA